jgi:hypothetical protein
MIIMTEKETEDAKKTDKAGTPALPMTMKNLDARITELESLSVNNRAATRTLDKRTTAIGWWIVVVAVIALTLTLLCYYLSYSTEANILFLLAKIISKNNLVV